MYGNKGYSPLLGFLVSRPAVCLLLTGAQARDRDKEDMEGYTDEEAAYPRRRSCSLHGLDPVLGSDKRQILQFRTQSPCFGPWTPSGRRNDGRRGSRPHLVPGVPATVVIALSLLAGKPWELL